MPYNIYTNSYYKIDYYKAKVTLTTLYQPLGSSIQHHISEWLLVLETLDNSICNSNSIYISDAEQYFGYNYSLVDKNVFSVCFNITSILNTIDKKMIPFDLQTVSLSSFDTKGNKYQYSDEAESSSSTGPVIVTEAPTLTPYLQYINEEFFVLDGNHRVSEAKRKRNKTIEVIKLNKDSLINSNAPFFVSTYDKFVYAFLTELTEATIAIKRHNISSNTFIENSFLQQYSIFN